MTHEWDWPPRFRRRARIERRHVYLPQRSGWGSPAATKAVDWYVWTIVTIVKVLVAVPLALVLFGCLWLIKQMVIG
jgi:hypothetical protein